MVDMIVTTMDLKCNYDVIGPVYYQVSNKGIFSSALSIAKKKYSDEIASLRAQGQMNDLKADWGFLYGEWSVGQNDFDAAFFIAVQELKERAKRLGADAIIGMRQDIDMDTNAFAFFYLQMYGTAVKFKNKKIEESSMLASSNSGSSGLIEITTDQNPQGHAETIELLIKYKHMLDSGEITQEEFDEKKKAIL